MIDSQYHALLHRIIHFLGHEIPGESPQWLHSILHIILVWAPALLTIFVIHILIRRSWQGVKSALKRRRRTEVTMPSSSVFAFILKYTQKQQILLISLGLVSLPLLYITLELPKLIINSAIDADEHTTEMLGQSLSQMEHLFVLCAIYLVAILAGGSNKLALNIYKGKVGERLLRRLRLVVFRRWRQGAGGAKRGEIIPIIVQEVEPIGGFASDALALPVFQGGTFLTILIFMFMQDPYLGAAAVTLLPLQIALIPRFQRRINQLARRRVGEVRALGGQLGEQAASMELSREGVRAVGSSLRQIELIRRRIHRIKFLMKGLNNFLTALTPFFFFSIGGYLVIDEQLSLGALVAVLAAYKDFSAPLRELFRYYQNLEDVKVRFNEIERFLAQDSAIEIRNLDPIGAS